VNLVDGVDVSTHQSRHLPNGSDPLTTAAPAASLSATTTNSQGVAATFGRSDHGHAILTGTAVALAPDQANSAGVSANLIRADHVHNVPTAAPITSLSATTTNSQGAAATFARSDHGHAILTAAPVSTGTSNTTGSSASLARADHVHDTVISRNEVSSASAFNTSSATDVVITGFTLTPSAGTYFVSADIVTSQSTNNAVLTASVYSAGVQVTNSERVHHHAPAGGNRPTHLQAFVTLNGSQAVDIRVRTSAGTLTVNQRSLIILRVGP